MPASTEQKVDFLLKKIGYSASKTGGVEGSSGTVDGTKKKPSEEAIPSPLIVPSTSLWSDSVSIPATPPGSDTFPVKVYATASAYRLTVDNSVSESRSFIARSTYGNQTSSIDGNWIDSQFGADYAVRVFKGDPNSGGVELSQAGATGNDTWFFDYSSGILNFTGTDNHSTIGVTDTNIYILGYRYTGGIGAKPPSGIGTFSSLYVTGISTFVGLVDINGGGQANTFKVEDLTAGRVTYAGTGGELQDSANLTFDANSNLNVTGGLVVTGVTTTSGLVDINAGGQANTFKVEDLTQYRVVLAGGGGELQDDSKLTFDANSNFNITGGLKVTGITTLGSVGISTGLISGPATMYIDPATVGDDTGLLVVKGNLQVDGTQTTVNSSTMTVTDKNIVVAQGSANDAASDGAGITVDAGSDTDKTLNWVDATDAWTSSEHIQVAAGKQLGFADDTNTYIDRPAADTIKFTAGGSERLRINTDGNTKITGAFNVTGVSTFSGNVGFATDITWGGSDYTSNTPFTFEQKSNIGVSTFLFQSRGSNQPEFTFRNVHSGNWGVNFNSGTQYHKFIWEAPNEVGIATVDNGYLVNRKIAALQEITTNTGGNKPKFQFRVNDETSTLVRVWTADHETQTWRVGDVGKLTLNSTGFTVNTPFFANGDTTLGDNTNDDLTITARVASDIEPKGNDNYSLGSAKRWLTVYSKQLNITGITTTATLNVGVSGQTLVGINTILDEDNMASDSATALATQQSIKKYVDDRSPAGPGGGNLAVSADSGTNQSINLNTDILDIEGTANEIVTVTGSDKVIIGLPDDVTIANDLTVASNAGIGSLSVTGVSTFTGNIDANGDLDVDGNTELDDLNVSGISTFAGVVRINSGITPDTDEGAYLGDSTYPWSSAHIGEVRIASGSDNNEIDTATGNLILDSAGGTLDVNDNVDISGNLVVGAAGTTITTTVGAAASVGIGTANPAYMLDVAGAINSSTDVKINGTSVLNSALDEAVAMAIALG